MCNLQSFIGINVLYKLLRQPVNSQKELKSRENIINYFQSSEDNRVKIQYTLRKMLNRNQNICIDKHINISTITKKKLIIFKIIKLILFSTLASTIYFRNNILILCLTAELIGIIAINFHYYYTNQSNQYLYVINMIKCAYKIKKLNIDVINERYSELENSLTKFKGIKNKVTNSSLDNTDLRNLYLKMLRFITMSDLISNEEIHYLISNNNKEYEYLYNFIGEIDAFISVGFFRNSLDNYCMPEFWNKNKIYAVELSHPLLEKGVTNSININSSTLITGCNASGKSTFLRCVGVNLILSQTINTVCSDSFKTNFCNVITSMSLRDSLKKGDSYYIAEIKAIKRMIDISKKKGFFVFIIDEILKGTNTMERIAGGASILNFLSKDNTICFAATHDLELAHILNNRYKNYNFDGSIESDTITFDYKIKEGVSKKKNALDLLKKYNYDDVILDETEMRIDKFIKSKQWT